MPEPIINKPRVVKKVWGEEIIFENNEEFNYCGKILRISNGYQMSIHSHKEKEETFFLIEGRVVLLSPVDGSGDEIRPYAMNAGGAIRIPKNTEHSIVAIANSMLVEASTFDKEEDSFRTTGSKQASEELIKKCEALFQE